MVGWHAAARLLLGLRFMASGASEYQHSGQDDVVSLIQQDNTAMQLGVTGRGADAPAALLRPEARQRALTAPLAARRGARRADAAAAGRLAALAPEARLRRAERVLERREAERAEAEEQRERRERLDKWRHSQVVQQTVGRRKRQSEEHLGHGTKAPDTNWHESSDSDTVQLHIQYLAGEHGKDKETRMVVRRTTPMSVLMKYATKRLHLFKAKPLLFMHNGRPLKPEDTAKTYNMRDLDLIKIRARK